LNDVGGRRQLVVNAGRPVAHNRAAKCQGPLLIRSVVDNVHLLTIYKVSRLALYLCICVYIYVYI